MRCFLTVLSLSFLFSKTVQAQQFVNFTAIEPSQCVAPSAYLSCYEGVIENTAKCMNETAGNPTAQKGCGCVDGEQKISCFAGACWNRVCPSILSPRCPRLRLSYSTLVDGC
jgi:hypothetical protein